MYQRNDFCDPKVNPTAPTIRAFLYRISGLVYVPKKALTIWAEGAVWCTVGSQKLFLWYIDQLWYPI